MIVHIKRRKKVWDKMKETTNGMKRGNSYILLVIMTFMFSLMLLGCDSETTTETAKSEPEAVVNEDTPPVEEVVKVPEEATIIEETVVEEPAEELYIPEGIDMESTLPGEEWVASFAGKVTEPVVVIYNDNTGRKEVVQADSEITVNPDEDMIAVYWNEIGMGCTTHAIATNGLIVSDYYEIELMDSVKMRDIPKRPARVTVTNGAEDWVIEFTILVE